MKLLERIASGEWQMQPRGLCNGGVGPDYDTVRWPGADGLRVPQEMAPATLMVKKETDLGSISGTVIVAPNQALSSFITATPTANATLQYPVVIPGLPIVISNLAVATYTLTVSVKGNANTVVIPPNTTAVVMMDSVSGGLLPITFYAATGGSSLAGYNNTLYTGATDAVLFPAAVNVATFLSTTPDAATLATPVAGDAGKVLILVNQNTSQTTVTTAANKILNGTATPGDTLTAPAHAGAVTILVVAGLFWNLGVFGTGSWVLSEV